MNWNTGNRMNVQGMMKKGGFTLLEVIASIVITAMLAAMLVTLMGNPLTRSADPVLKLKGAYDLQKVMENMAAVTNGLPSIGIEGSSQSNLFGAYQVVRNRYILFNGGNETSGGTNMLKVTIKNTDGDQLTRLFCQ